MPFVTRNTTFLCLLGIALVLGCGDSSCEFEFEPLEKDLSSHDKVYDGITAEISPEGFGFIEMNFDGIVRAFMEDGLSFDIPGDPGSDCPESGCSGQRVCNRHDPCPVTAELDHFRVLRGFPNKLYLHANLNVHSGMNARGPAESIPVRVCQSTLVCNKPVCDVEITVVDKPVALEIILDVDPTTNAMTFELGETEVVVTEDDYDLDGGFRCSAVAFFFKGWLTNMINDMIQEQALEMVQEVIDDMTCMPCDYFTSGCEQGTGVQGVRCDDDTGWCHASGSDCVRQPLGLVGKIDIADLVPDIELPSTPLDFHVGVGQRRGVAGDPFIIYDGGPLQLRAIAGAAAETYSHCVPEPSSIPRTDTPPRVDFFQEAGGMDYHVGVAVSDRMLNKAMYEAYRSGSLCVELGSDLNDMVSTGMLSTFLSSLAVLTEDKNSRLFVAVRPKDRPELHIGEGTYRMEGERLVLDEPFITALLNDVNIDVYAFLEDRYFRILTLNTDAVIPFGLDLTPDNEFIPILGDLEYMVQRLEVMNSDILAEDPASIAEIVQWLINLVEPMIARVFVPIAIPDFQGFRLNVRKMTAAVPHEEPKRFEHFVMHANLELVGTPAPFTHVQPSIDVTDVRQRKACNEGINWVDSKPAPSFVIQVGESPTGPVEWQYRIGGGFWSPFQTASSLEIQSPKLRVQGRHIVEVRTRQVGVRSTLDAQPVSFDILVDYEAPRVRVFVDQVTGIAEVRAEDRITPTHLLEYSYSVDGGSFTAYMPQADFELPIGANRLEVRVRDEAGNVAETTWSDPLVRGERVSPDNLKKSRPQAGGCVSSTGVGLLLSFLLIAAFASVFLRRQRRDAQY